MIGQTFKTLTVIRHPSREETPWKSHSTPLLCKCNQCGKEAILRKEDVEKGCVDCKISGGRGHQSLKAGDRFGKLTVIEYDAPHKTAGGRWGGKEKLQIQKERDERKNIYCKEQGIPLIRIPYTVKLSDLTFDDISPSSRFQI